MPRVKRGMHHAKRRRHLMKRVKGFEAGRKNLMKLAKTADIKAGSYAYRDRRVKKRTARALWLIKINAALETMNMSYSKFMGQFKANNIIIDRKILSILADKYPKVFKSIVEAV